MSVLFDDARSSTPTHGRSSTGLWFSIVVHAVVGVALVVIPMRAVEKPPTPRARSIAAFVLPSRVELPPPAVEAPRRPAPAPQPTPVRDVARVEAPKPLPVVPAVAKVVEPTPVQLVPAVAAEVERPVERPVTGLFERTSSAPANQAAAAVTTGGFGSAAASPRGAANGAGGVTTGGFGSGSPAPRRTAAAGEVQMAGFEQRTSAPAQPAAAAVTKAVDQPVEIVSKPTPEYTDEARTARVEGTVSLELEFTAAGDVRVLRLVRGLGHGLDEAAQRAALRIRFKPAQSAGRPVDSRATVHITFRLS